MQVLITGHTPLEGQDWWYKKYLGERIEIDNQDGGLYQNKHPRFISLDIGAESLGCSILKQDCHVIQPTWQVMKEHEETGREVQYWHFDAAMWRRAKVNDGEEWSRTDIYRLNPEPPKPEYVPLSGEELIDLVGEVVTWKDTKTKSLVTDSSEDGRVWIKDGWYNAQEMLDKFTLDGSPVGKIKQ